MSLEIIIINENENKAMGPKCSAGVNHCLYMVESLGLSITRLTGNHFDEKSGSTNYLTLKESEEFSAFQNASSELAFCGIHLLNEEERKCFFINIYNVLTIHALAYSAAKNAGLGAISSVLHIGDFWKKYCYRIGDHLFSLDDIEHGILRGNREHPTTHVVYFREDDPRICLTLTSFDARIHFALNCGAKSCPLVRVYSSDNLEDKLEMVTKSYLAQEIQSKKLENGDANLSIPQIFEWYGYDFASDTEGVLRWILTYVEEGSSIQAVIEDILKSGYFSGRIEYGYDWSLA